MFGVGDSPYCQGGFGYHGGDELKTAPLQGKALELGFPGFPWLINDDDDESLIACRPESWPMARGSYQRAPWLIKKESTNYNWEEDLDVRA